MTLEQAERTLIEVMSNRANRDLLQALEIVMFAEYLQEIKNKDIATEDALHFIDETKATARVLTRLNRYNRPNNVKSKIGDLEND